MPAVSMIDLMSPPNVFAEVAEEGLIAERARIVIAWGDNTNHQKYPKAVWSPFAWEATQIAQLPFDQR